MQREADADGKAPVHHGGRQSAVEGRGQVVRVALHGVGDVEETLSGQLIAPEHVSAHGTRHQQGGGGAKAAADGNVGVDVDFHAPHFLAHGVQHGAVGGVGQIVRAGEGFVAAGDLQTGVRLLKGHVRIQAQGAPEGIKPRPQVGGGCRHPDGYLIHFSVSFSG